MVAEFVRALRLISRPFRKEYWWQRSEARTSDRTRVLLISLADLRPTQSETLRRVMSSYHPQPLLDSQLPPLHKDEHFCSDPKPLGVYRVLFFLWCSLRMLPYLLSGRRSVAAHLLETDDLARVHYALSKGLDFVHLSSLSFNPVAQLRRLKRSIRSNEHQRYELWVIDRESAVAYLPPSFKVPDVPISTAEVVEIAKDYPCLNNRSQALKRYPKAPGTLRVMSYNLHSCIGLDGRASVQRIAEVLHRYEPDFVALQEVDVGCARSGGVNQLELLRELWPSEGQFYPLLPMSGGSYGIGFLSRLPVIDWKGTLLPQLEQSLAQEQRGLVEVKVQPEGWPEPVLVLNTHLGLTRKQRMAQLKGILRREASEEPQVLTGDFNCSPRSQEYLRILRYWNPTQDRPVKTWFGTFPIRHLDYCFVRGDLEVIDSWTPRDSHTRVASDHLPLITDLKLPEM